jgi:SAM-dependent methyltransferase
VPAAAIARRVVAHARSRGAGAVAADCASWAWRWLTGRPFAGRPTRATFAYDGAERRYQRSAYNYTWLNERAVEIPLATAQLDAAVRAARATSATPLRVLEVGNVLSHYLPDRDDVRHTVVDKYERAPGVLNLDVVDLAIAPDLPAPFDLVLAVSTIEHVGLDEQLQDPGKPARAIAALTELLAPDGRLWCTFPVGYNPALDARLREGGLGATRLTALRRTGRDNRWEQVPVEDVWGIGYDRLLYTAHALVVAEWNR